MSGSFSRANRLWFDEGRTAAALRLYDLAGRERPDDPAVLFQRGLALWGVDRFDEATALLLRAQETLARPEVRDRLARQTLEAWIPQFTEAEAPRHYPEFAPEDLDADLFGSVAPGGNWRLVADCAAERRMFGVADLALQRWGRAPIDGEEARELDEIHVNLEAQLQAIRILQRSARNQRS